MFAVYESTYTFNIFPLYVCMYVRCVCIYLHLILVSTMYVCMYLLTHPTCFHYAYREKLLQSVCDCKQREATYLAEQAQLEREVAVYRDGIAAHRGRMRDVDAVHQLRIRDDTQLGTLYTHVTVCPFVIQESYLRNTYIHIAHSSKPI